VCRMWVVFCGCKTFTALHNHDFVNYEILKSFSSIHKNLSIVYCVVLFIAFLSFGTFKVRYVEYVIAQETPVLCLYYISTFLSCNVRS
jgi:TRAP-type C4-dicarboxylate transport system permease small subunit